MKATENHDILKFLPSSWNRDWFLALLLVVGTMVAYLPVRHAGFIWDDLLLKNPMVPQAGGWYRAWFNRAVGDYVPATITSFWLEWRLWGANPLGYHIDNVLLHVCSALLLWRILLRLKIPGAWLAAALFAIHPVNVKSVAWIAERKNTLTMLLLLAAVQFYLTLEDSGRRRWLWLAAGIFLLALMGKTAVVPLPFVLLGLAWWRRGRIDRKDIQHSLVFFALAAAGSLMAVWIQKGAAIGMMERTDSFWARLAGAGWALWFYLGKALLPLNLNFVYPRWEIPAGNPLSYLPLVLWVTGSFICWRYRNGWSRGPLFALGYFSVMLLPVLGFVNISFMSYSLVSDHWQYFAIIGPLALVAAGLSTMTSGNKWVTGICGVTLLAGLGALTWKQCRLYTNAETLWMETIRLDPDCWMAHANLGGALLQKGRLDEAVAHLQKSLQLNPENPEAHGNLGLALFQKGDVDGAIAEFQRLLQIRPDDAKAHRDLGIALLEAGRNGNAGMRQGKMAQAIIELKTAARLQPDDIPAQKEIAGALFKMGKAAEAIPYCEAVVKAEPEDAHAHFDLGWACLAGKRPEQALANYQEAVRLAPDAPQSLNALAWVYATSPKAGIRKGTEAVRLATRACEITKRHDTEMLDTLAAAYAEAGRFDEAIKTTGEILALAVSGHDTNTADTARQRLELYKAGKPYRDEH